MANPTIAKVIWTTELILFIILCLLTDTAAVMLLAPIGLLYSLISAFIIVVSLFVIICIIFTYIDFYKVMTIQRYRDNAIFLTIFKYVKQYRLSTDFDEYYVYSDIKVMTKNTNYGRFYIIGIDMINNALIALFMSISKNDFISYKVVNDKVYDTNKKMYYKSVREDYERMLKGKDKNEE